MPGFLYGYQKFREQFELPIVRNGDEERLERLQKMIRPFILRRLKKEVLKDLPDKIEKNMAACMEQKQKELYHAHAQRLALILQNQTEEEFADSRFQVLSELTRLRQLCCDPALVYENYEGGSAKLDLCIELIQSAVESGHKILLFSQFTSMIEILTARLQEESISCFVLQGSTKKERRAQMVEQFNRDDTSVFCISLKAGGTGLNLTGADIVIHYDPWWNVAVENQATDRAHRIGQKNVVTVYKLIAKGTIEEKIIKLQQMKKSWRKRSSPVMKLRQHPFRERNCLSFWKNGSETAKSRKRFDVRTKCSSNAGKYKRDTFLSYPENGRTGNVSLLQ